MIFNIFANILYGEPGELAPTFSEKFEDTLSVMTGTDKKMGLFDYITLFITIPFFWFFAFVMGLSLGALGLIFSRPFLAIILSPLSIPMLIISWLILNVLQFIRFSTGYITSFLLLPVITLVHFISVLSKKDLSNSFGEKIEDMFLFINGDDSLGLFDHLTLLIKRPIDFFFVLSIEAISLVWTLPILGILILPVSLPMIVTSGIISAIYYSVRFLVSVALTGLTLPFVALTHVIAVWNKQRILKHWVTDRIEYAAIIGNSVTITSPQNLALSFDQTLTNHLIEELNNHSAIDALRLPGGYSHFVMEGFLDYLIPRLNHVIRIETTYTCTDNTLALIPQSPIEHLKFNARHISENGLFELLKQNKKVAQITMEGENPYNANSSTHFINLMQSEGIQQPCTLEGHGYAEKINDIMKDISEVHHMIKNCFEFLKCSRNEGNENYLPQDIRNYIMLLMCPRDIVEQNQKGFISAIQSKGFFSTQTKPLHVEEYKADEHEQLIPY